MKDAGKATDEASKQKYQQMMADMEQVKNRITNCEEQLEQVGCN